MFISTLISAAAIGIAVGILIHRFFPTISFQMGCIFILAVGFFLHVVVQNVLKLDYYVVERFGAFVVGGVITSIIYALIKKQ